MPIEQWIKLAVIFVEDYFTRRDNEMNSFPSDSDKPGKQMLEIFAPSSVYQYVFQLLLMLSIP
jgi:hypothetical protein